MRKSPLLFLLATLLVSAPASAGVFLSELCDPQNNYTTDRFIEIYNSGPGVVDLTGWKIIAVANNVDVTTWTLSGTIAASEARVAGSPAPATVFPIHYASSAWLSGYFNWNGKIGDGAKLVDGGNVVRDLIVAPGDLFENKTLVRIASVTEPSASYNAAQWTATPVLTAPAASPGSHNGSLPPAGGPRITNVALDPAAPPAGVPVDVQAAVVDTSGAVATVTLQWGQSAGSLPNVIGMTLLSDSTYRTSTPIPGQTSGASVFYRVQAQGASATTLSSTLSYTIPGGSPGTPPSVLAVGEMSDSTLLVFFSEPVEEASAEIPANYSVGALGAVAAARDSAKPAQVLITVRNLAPGSRTLTVSGVSDLDGNTAFGASRAFNYVDVTIPAGYYNSALGLSGTALRQALHNIIDNHTVGSYSFALTAFTTTDVKPNGKVWDMYSDIPGGVPAYEYSFDQTGQGATEGLGYNREHSWPDSWFGGASPMHTDLWILYPTDAKVNGYRSNYPFGEVGSATTISTNGSRLGTSASPGYSGTVFEPIDAYKGDFARGQFYVATRYFGEDGAWPGSPSADGANILPWAVQQYSDWAATDPVSWKERMRNGAVSIYQNNRNPFVDHPEFLALIYDSSSVVGVGDGVAARSVHLRPNLPNPFSAHTTVRFDLAKNERVTLRVFDVRGRLVGTLADGSVLEAGRHQVEWTGQDAHGTQLAAGLYLLRLDAGSQVETRRMALIR